MTNVSMTTPTISKTTEKTISAEGVHEIQLKAMGGKKQEKGLWLKIVQVTVSDGFQKQPADYCGYRT